MPTPSGDEKRSALAASRGIEATKSVNSLRGTFDRSAERYHRARPGYPERLFGDLIEITGIDERSQLLEIGPGTGKATLPLAERGFSIQGIELGGDLAAVARENLSLYPKVRIEVGEFETFPIEARSCNLVYSATAFHWIRQPEGFQKIATILEPDGHFAEFRHHHVWSEASDDFFQRSQEVYRNFHPKTPSDFRLPLVDEVQTLESVLEASQLFEPPEIRRYAFDVVHSPESYADLLWTFSDHIAMPEPNRSRLIDGIAEVIAKMPGGRAVKSHLVVLHVAKLRDRQPRSI